jgi:hypothetical protein
MGDIIMEAKGHNGQLELTESVVRITRRGLLAFLSQGLDKEIPIWQIASTQFKKANHFVNGHIQLVLVRGQEVKGGIFPETKSIHIRLAQRGAPRIHWISSHIRVSRRPCDAPQDLC